MAEYEFTPDRTLTRTPAVDQQVTAFLRSVYGWMCAGLGITAFVAASVAQSPALVAAIAGNRLAYFGLMIAQIGLVVWLSARAQSMAASTAALLFAAYSALTGVTFAFILLAFTGESIALTFLTCSGMFGALALYGTTTSRSLAGWGQFLFMGLVGVVLASIVGIFWHSEGLQFGISVIGVIVFTGLTAYDAQRLKQMAVALPSGGTATFAIVGALTLYLDFINLFLMLLRFTGSRRN
jgi:FtsH-binding integral membrane protein